MTDLIKIAFKLSHYDTKLIEKLSWFQKQPGILWQEWAPDNTRDKLPVLNITRNDIFLSEKGERFFFHPSMALLRLINIQRGQTDRYLEATALKSGDSLLDLTLGLGTDALIGAWAVGKEGKVTGIEQSAIITALIKDGLRSLAENPLPKVANVEKRKAWEELAQAARRINVIWQEHGDFLRTQPAHCIDVIYFDPMFRRTQEKSSSIQPLHLFSDHRALTVEAIIEAYRVARKRIILKERKNSPEFARLGFRIMSSGKYSQVDYGIISL